MAKDSSVWRGNWGRLSITTLIAVAIGLVIWKNGEAFGLTSNGLKLLGSVAAIILLLLARHGKIISLAILQQWSRLQGSVKMSCRTMKVVSSRQHHAMSPLILSVTPCVTSTVGAGDVKHAFCWSLGPYLRWSS